MNLIANNLVTTKDIKIAEQIYGQDMGFVEGKTTRKWLTLVINDYIEISEELIIKQQNVILCIDSIKVSGLLFLTTILKKICYQIAQFAEIKIVSNNKEALSKTIQLCNQAGFKIIKIRSANKF
jgi:hypothetical protein